MESFSTRAIVSKSCRSWPPSSVDTIITDPPYGLEFMGQAWDRLDWQFGAGFGKPGIGNRNIKWPRFSPNSPFGTANPTCGSCGGRLRGKKKCRCETPKWKPVHQKNGNSRALQGLPDAHRAIQEWHRKWASSAWRVAKPGAFLLAFGGTRTFHRLACALEEAGWLVRDCIMWLYGSGFPKSMDISKAIDKAAGTQRRTVGVSSGPNHSHYSGKRYTQHRKTRFGVVQDQPDLTAPSTSAAKEWSGWGTGLKPAWEPIIVAMKPLDGTFAQNAQKHDVAGLWIDGVRIPANDIRSGGFGNGKRPWQSGPVGGNTQYVSSEQGRWPTNVILDKEAAAMLDEQSGERRAGGAPQQRFSPKTENTYGEYGMDCPHGLGCSVGGASRFFYCAKASNKERDLGLRKGLLNGHPTVKPLKLMEYLCKLTATPAGGIILDPFAGSGSTLIAAQNVGRKCIGIECDREYVRIAQARLRASTAQRLKGGLSKAA